MKMDKMETSSVDEKSIVVSCGPQVSSSVDEKLMSVGCVDQVRSSINNILPKGFKLEDIEKTLGEDLELEIFEFMKDLHFPFPEVLNKIENSIFTLVNSNKTILEHELDKDQFITFLHERAKNYCRDKFSKSIIFRKKKGSFLNKWEYSTYRISTNKKLPEGSKLEDIEKKLGEDLDNEIFVFFNGWKLPFLKVLNKIEKSVFTLVDNNKTISEYKLGKDQFITFLHERAKNYCRDNFSESIIFRKKKTGSFLDKWEYSIKKRNCAGVILRTQDKKILFTVTTKKLINFPFGKQDHEDDDHLKTTGLRELYEEAGHYWQACEAEKGVKYYVDTPFVSNIKYESGKFDSVNKIHRFYFVDNFKEANIKMDYEKPKEIAELKWLDIGVIKDFFSNKGLNEKRVENKLLKPIKFDYHKLKVKIGEKEYRLADSVRNFLQRKSPLSDYLLNVSTTLEGCSKDISEVKESYLKLKPKGSQ